MQIVGILFKRGTKIISWCNKLHAFTFCAIINLYMHVMHMLKTCKCGDNFLRLIYIYMYVCMYIYVYYVYLYSQELTHILMQYK